MIERLKVCRFLWHPAIRQAKLLKASRAGYAAAGRCTTRLIADFCERCFGLSRWKHAYTNTCAGVSAHMIPERLTHKSKCYSRL